MCPFCHQMTDVLLQRNSIEWCLYINPFLSFFFLTAGVSCSSDINLHSADVETLCKRKLKSNECSLTVIIDLNRTKERGLFLPTRKRTLACKSGSFPGSFLVLSFGWHLCLLLMRIKFIWQNKYINKYFSHL